MVSNLAPNESPESTSDLGPASVRRSDSVPNSGSDSINEGVPISQRRVLILEDNTLLRELMSELILGVGFSDITAAATLEEAQDCINTAPPDLVVADWRLKPENTTAEALIEHCDLTKTKLLIVSGYGDERFVATLKDLGVHALVRKPFGTRDFVYAVFKLCADLENEDSDLFEDFEGQLDFEKVVELN